MILIDTNILIDLIDEHSRWKSWSQDAVEKAALAGTLAINHIILAEIHGRYETARQFATLRFGLPITVVALDEATAGRAGAAFQLYRSRGGDRTSMIADFLIGAHAATLGVPIITRDHARFASYFPELTLITPESDP